MQVNGVAMENEMGPNGCYVEAQIFNQFDDLKPDLFVHYIDDRLWATSCTNEELERFIGFVNSFHPALKFTWEISETSATFSYFFLISTFLSRTIIWQTVFTTDPQIRTVTYCIHLPTHLTTKTQFCISSFSGSVDSNFFFERGYPDNILSKALIVVFKTSKLENLLWNYQPQTLKNELLSHLLSTLAI